MMIVEQSRTVIILAIVAVLSWWMVNITEREETVVNVVEKNSIEYFSVDYSKLEMDEFGTPKNYLLADKMTHYSEDATTHLEKPIMTLYNNSVSPWVIQSDTGVLLADGENILLNGTVLIKREAADNIRSLTINTSDLRVKVPTNYAETDKWTEIISLPNRTTGTGMKVTFVEPIHLRLLSKVKGRYEIN